MDFDFHKWQIRVRMAGEYTVYLLFASLFMANTWIARHKPGNIGLVLFTQESMTYRSAFTKRTFLASL